MSNSDSGAHVIDQLLSVGPRSSRAELRLEAIERHLKNELWRLDDEENVRVALLAAYSAARASGLTDREFFARMNGIDSATWYAWMTPRRPATQGTKPKRIPSWPTRTILRVCPEARDAFLGSLCEPMVARRAG